jgi:hypothetical protein
VTTAIVRIEKCIQDIQSVSAEVDKSAMRSQIFFQLEIKGKVIPGLVVEISQPYGCDYASEPVEVGPPQDYNGPFNHDEFSERIEQYYRSILGRCLSFSGCGSVRMTNNTFVMPAEFTIEIGESKNGGW